MLVKLATMKLILGLLPGMPVRSSLPRNGKLCDTKANRHIGYLSDVPAFYDYLTLGVFTALCINHTYAFRRL